MTCRTVFIFVLFSTFFGFSQTKNNEWQIGIGAAITKFSDKDAAYIGDRHLFQVPRLNLTMPIGNNFSLDGALSFNTFDLDFIKNSAHYFSMDGSLRYNFNNVAENLYPYIFTGGSWVDSERKMTPTLNFGAGLTYWISNVIGLNSQLYYKHSFEGYESMRSHIQITGGLVFAFDMKTVFSKKSGESRCYYDQIK